MDNTAVLDGCCGRCNMGDVDLGDSFVLLWETCYEGSSGKDLTVVGANVAVAFVDGASVSGAVVGGVVVEGAGVGCPSCGQCWYGW